jgi:hypothetical protein
MVEGKIYSNISKHFGYRHLGFIFRSLVVLQESGFCYRKKRYSWKNVAGIEVIQKIIRDEGETYGVGLGEIHLNSGKILLIKEQGLEREDGGRESGFSSAFDELLFELKKRHKHYLAKND